jgi:NAD(P) transhydrogenase subunit alpha
MSIRIGVPGEQARGECRIAATPESVAKLKTAGFDVTVQRGAGQAAGYSDAQYEAAGAALSDGAEPLWKGSDVVLKVRPPSAAEVAQAREGLLLVSLVQPERNPELPGALNAAKVTALALERVPRVTRAQKMDVLSSQANLSGYRAVVEAAAAYQGFFGPQMTAAGATPPAKVLIIGAGVAGLAAVGAAKALGAEVRAFDTRAAAREQVESLGAKFLTVDMEESGDGGGGYGKVMSQAFIDAEMALFRKQGAEVDIVISTALVPGTKAPVLLPKDVVACLKPGSVVVDMAAEQGGNCELTVPGEVVTWQGVKILGFTDLASRMANTASRFFAMNLVHLLNEMGGGAGFKVDVENDVIRPALVTMGGETLPPPPRKDPSPAAAPKPKPAAPAPQAAAHKSSAAAAKSHAWTTIAAGVALAALFAWLGKVAPPAFLPHFTVFVLACFVGWQVVWSVTAALHTPLMSVTNAISGIILVGGLLQVGAEVDAAGLLGAAAVLFASINVAGGFLVTQRMLKMFRKGPEGGAR